jgi:sulfatase maturation enzyme AslB (radical SAM superfamily)
MGAAALSAFLDSNNMPPDGVIVTAVLPGGCPLSCPFCFVGMRGERQLDFVLTSEHLPALMHEMRLKGLLGAAAIVGDEPLQSKVWPYTRSFLTYGHDAGVPMALITNGFELADFAKELSQFRKLKLLVSVDAVGEDHDRIRRREGAFARLAAGIKAAMSYDSMRRSISLAATLMPNNDDKLKDVIAFASQNGIEHVTISPLLHVDENQRLRAHPKVLSMAAAVTSELMTFAQDLNVGLRFSDEFGVLGEWEDVLRQTGITVAVPKVPVRLIRVDAAGRIETIDTIRAGTSTGLNMPHQLQQISELADALIPRNGVLPLAA